MQSTIEIIKDYLIYNHLVSGLIMIALVVAAVNIIIPRVIVVAVKKKLIIPIIKRSSHNKEVPSLGGISFFMVYLITIPLINMIHYESFAGYNIIAAISILFMVGLKDDLVNSSPRVKLYGQFLASGFIVLSPEFLITNYHGFLGIYEINPFASMFISMGFIVFFINSFNLIDGLDGLASFVGIVISAAFLIVFSIREDFFYSSLALVTIAMLVAFLRFNLTKGKLKIFMGDCGSLIIGLMISVLAVHYLASEPLPMTNHLFLPENRFIFVFSVLFIPLLDTARVIVIRILAGKHPMKADRNHLHHVLLDFMKSHIWASISLGLLNLIVIVTFISISNTFPIEVVSVVMVLMTLLVLLLIYTINSSNKKMLVSKKKQTKFHAE